MDEKVLKGDIRSKEILVRYTQQFMLKVGQGDLISKVKDFP